MRATAKRRSAIVYIGDGSSRANVLTIDQLDGLVNDLVVQRAPVIAFGVGPQIQEQLLGTLASRTGGVVVPEQASVDAGDPGASLAQAVHGTVLWPKAGGNVKWPEGMDVYPKTFPPLRSDRDTVLVGTEKSTAAKQVEIDVDGPAGAAEAGLGHSRIEVQRHQRIPGHPGESGEGRRRPDAALDR